MIRRSASLHRARTLGSGLVCSTQKRFNNQGNGTLNHCTVCFVIAITEKVRNKRPLNSRTIMHGKGW